MFLYFIEAGDAIKVGVATDVKSRISSIQTGNPHEIKILHTIDMIEDEAYKIEGEIHRLFQDTNLRGEWFQSTQFMTEYIENIKENGISSHVDWIKGKYKETYGELVKKIEDNLEIDTTRGNLISLDMLKEDLGVLINTVFLEPKNRYPMMQLIRDWAQSVTPGTNFTVKRIYMDLDIREEKNRHNVVVALARLVEGSELIDKLGRNRYIINDLQ